MRIWPTKRGWKRFGIALLILVAMALIVNGIFAWRAESQLRSRLAAIRAAGDPASIADLKPAPIPDDQNAAAIIDRIRPRLKEFSKAYGQFFNSPIGKEYDARRDQGEPPTKEQIDAIRGILNNFADVEQAIDKAADCDKFASRMDFTLSHRDFIEHMLDKVQEARTAARFLGWRHEVLEADGQHDAAIKNSIEALRLARLHENEPTLVAYLIAVAMRGIASEQLYDALAVSQTSPELHAAIDQELKQHDNPQTLPRVLKTERAVGADWIVDQLKGRLSGLKNMIGWSLKWYQIGVLNAMDEYIAFAAQPYSDVRTQFGVTNGPVHRTGHGVLADSLVPALQSAFQANARSLAVSRALRLDSALRAFAEKNGREAKGLEELGLPREATIDPFSGEPLKLKYTDDGWIVYSVMTNGVDDGGDFMDMKDYGVAPRKWRRVQ